MKVYVAELTYRGTEVEWDSIYRQRTNLGNNEKFGAYFPPFQRMFYMLEMSLNEACLALMFFEAYAGRAWPRPNRDEREEMRRVANQRTQEIENELKAAYDPAMFQANFQLSAKISEEASLLYRREEWSRGEMPKAFKQLIPHTHAKSFLYAMDRISKVLRSIPRELTRANETWEFLTNDEKHALGAQTSRLTAICNAFHLDFPGLRGVRDSSAHIEERIQFRAKNREIDIRRGPGSVEVMTETLLGNVFTSLMSDGTHGELEISERSLLTAQKHIQEAIDVFGWEGGGPLTRPI